MPVLRFDSRELFFPAAVDGYVANSTLLIDDQEVVADGDLDLNMLDARFGPSAHLRFISDLDRRSVLKDEAKRLARKLFGPRLGRVGLFGRILDALFLLSVFIRPTTPRLTTAAAALKAERLSLQSKRVCYGRAKRLGEWLVLHYSYFYVMNDWRSGYRGLNDHEADWEQAWIFCDPKDNSPVWVAASSHEHDGVDLRRHWDDPELAKVGESPVLYVGAGSHALYFSPGDYVTRIDVPPLRWLLRAQLWIRRALRIRDENADRGLGPALGAPFVDAAVGDGLEVSEWDFKLLDDETPAFGGYRGLWGFDTGDPANGERGPAGPKFKRSGDIRQSWADPVGFADLSGVPPPSAAGSRISLQRLTRVLDDLNVDIRHLGRILPLVEKGSNSADLKKESARLTDLLRQRTELEDLARQLERGELHRQGIRDHLVHPATPIPPPKETGWILAIWAASSIPLLLLSFGALFLFDGLGVAVLFASMTAGMSLLEQLARRHFQASARLALLYLVAAGLLFFVFGGVVTVSRYAIGAGMVVLAGLLFVANLGELGAVQRRTEAVSPLSDGSAVKGVSGS